MLHMTTNVNNLNIIHFENTDGDDDEDVHNVNRIQLSAKKNATASLLGLVSFGDTYFRNGHDDGSSLNDNLCSHKSSSWTKVRGCIADVRIKITMTNNHENPSTGTRVYITGTADSRIAQGMLALICKVSYLLSFQLLSLTILKNVPYYRICQV